MRGPVRERKKTTPSKTPPHITGEIAKQQLSAAAGTEAFQHRDPIRHLEESFCHTFDLCGQQRARGEEPQQDTMLSAFMKAETPGLSQDGAEQREGDARRTQEAAEDPTVTGELLNKTSMQSDYEPRDRDPGRQQMLRFADVAFQRGRLSAAVVRGTGKMMLFSCLERTAGQEKAKQRKERKLFQSSSLHRPVAGHREDISIVNRGFADSAVGLVVSALGDARETLDTLTAMAEGKKGPDGVGTLQKQYPFLTDAKERELLEQYRQRLALLSGPGHEQERDVLLRAAQKAEAIIAKKDQMKRDFLQRLRQLSHSAVEAEKLFTSEEFLEAARRLETGQQQLPTDPDGEDGGGEDGENDREPQQGGSA